MVRVVNLNHRRGVADIPSILEQLCSKIIECNGGTVNEKNIDQVINNFSSTNKFHVTVAYPAAQQTTREVLIHAHKAHRNGESPTMAAYHFLTDRVKPKEEGTVNSKNPASYQEISNSGTASSGAALHPMVPYSRVTQGMLADLIAAANSGKRTGGTEDLNKSRH